MSTLAVKGPTRPLHLRSKSSSRTNRGNDSQSERDIKASRNNARRVSGNTNDDAATVAFVRRVLCGGQPSSSQSLEDLLPPLTSSNEIDLQLYAIIAVIIKDFVQTWYSKITPDHEFVDEVVHVIAHCTRGLEQRLRRVDLEALLLDEIPELINQHAEAFRTALSHADSTAGRSLGSDRRTIYHSLHPHPALSPIPIETDPQAVTLQRANEAAWRQLLVEGLLDHLLPPEDLRNPCLKVLVSEIFSEMIIGNVLGGKICQGWFFWDVITKAILAARPVAVTASEEKKPSRLDQYGLLSSAHASGREAPRPRHRVNSVYALIINIGWEMLRIALMVMGTIRTLFVQFTDAAQLPSRMRPGVRGDSSVPSSPDPSAYPFSEPQPSAEGKGAQSSATKQGKAAVLEMAAWRVPIHVLGLDLKSPWLVGALSLVQHYVLWGPGKVGAVDARLDRLLSHTLTTRLLNPTLLPALLRTVRANLFPNNSLAPGVPPPSTAAEIAAVRARCVDAVLSLVPPAARAVYFGAPSSPPGTAPPDHQRAEVDAVLALFEDAYANKHLVFAVAEVLVCRLFPELQAGAGSAP